MFEARKWTGDMYLFEAMYTIGYVAPLENTGRWAERLPASFGVKRLDAEALDGGAVAGCDAVLLPYKSEVSPQALVRRIRLDAGDVPILVTDVPCDSHLSASLFRAGVNDICCDSDDPEQFSDRLLHHIEKYRLRERQKQMEADLSLEVGNKTRHLENALTLLNRAYEDTLESLVVALDAREHATGAHSKRVALYTMFLSILAGVLPEKWQSIYRGSLLHDFGKIAIPDAILLKPGKLTTEEFEVIKTHTVHGMQILGQVEFLKDSAAIPRWHHEKFNGKGYPDGLAGEAIPLESRIFAIIDVYDALRTKRPYKEPLPHAECVKIIVADRGEHFDPALVDLFVGVPENAWDQLWESAGEARGYAAILDVSLDAAYRYRSERG